MSTSFRDRYGPWALVAGASSALGAAFADALGRRGVHLVLVAPEVGAVESLAERISRERGVTVRAVACDLGSPQLFDVLHEATRDVEVGLAVYDGATVAAGPLLSIPLDRALQLVDLHVRGPLVLGHVVLPAMVARGRGGLVLLSSVAGLQGAPNLATYAATQAFDTVLGQSLWAELRPNGVDVLVTCAGRSPPGDVADRALDRLGGGPLFAPGAMNWAAAVLLGRLLPRRAALAMIARARQP